MSSFLWPASSGMSELLATQPAASSRAKYLYANATANTFGVWAELRDALPYGVCGMTIAVTLGRATGITKYIVEVGVGASGSEIKVFTFHIARVNNAMNIAEVINIPLRFPKGARVSARLQSYPSDAVLINGFIVHYDAPFVQRGYATAEDYGVVIATSGATNIDPGGTANTDGAWVELTASTTRDHEAILLCLGSRANSALTSAGWLFDIGVGAAGSEVVLVQDIYVYGTATVDNIAPGQAMAKTHVAKGTRLSVRCKCTMTDATDRILGAMLVGFG